MKKTVLSAAIGDGRPDYRQSYVSGRAGNAGSYRVNTRTGRPDFAKNLFSPGGERMPMSVGLSFWQYAESGNYSTGLPSGWKFGFQQYVYASGSDYHYIDGDYRLHVFRPLGDGRYYDSEHTGLVFDPSSGTMTDGRCLTMTFSDGRLTQISEKTAPDGSADTLTVSYAATSVTVTDAAGRSATIAFGTNITVTRPDGGTYTLTVTGGRLTKISEPGVGEHTYSYDSSGRLISASAAGGDTVEFAYGADGKVQSVTEKLGSSALKKYAFDYIPYATHVDETKYPSGSSVTRSMAYTYADNGDALGSYELSDDEFSAVRFRSSDDYKRYVMYVNREESKKGWFSDYEGGGETMTAEGGLAYVMEQYNSLPSITEGEDYIYSFRVVPDEAQSTADAADVVLGFINDYYADPATTVVRRIYRSGGAQTVVVKMPAADRSAGRTMLLIRPGAGIKFELSHSCISKNPKRSDIDCVNFGASGASSYDEYTGGVKTTWYEAGDCRVGNDTEAVGMCGSDWLATLENRDLADSGTFILWHGDRSGAKLVTSGTSITAVLGNATASKTLAEIKYATLCERGTRRIFEYGSAPGGYFRGRTSNTVFKNNTNKKCEYYYDAAYREVRTVDSRGAVTEYAYDSYGNVTQTKTTADGKSVVRDCAYGAHDGSPTGGRYLISETEYLLGSAKTRKYRYNQNTGDMIKSISTAERDTDYEYYTDGSVKKISSSEGGTQNANEFVYENGRLKSITHNSFAYDFAYNSYGDVSSVKVGSKKLLDKTYTHSPTADTSTVKYSDIAYVEKKYDAYGRHTETTVEDMDYYNIVTQKNIYGAVTDDVSDVSSPNAANLTINADSKLRKRIDNDYATMYNYNSSGQVTKAERTDGVTVTYGYDADGRQTSEYAKLPGNYELQYSYGYTDGDAINPDRINGGSVTFNNGLYLENTETRDKFGRITSRERNFSLPGYEDILGYVNEKDTYEYAAGGAGGTTEYISKVTRVINGSTETVTYGYDGEGNIVARTGRAYTYDGQNRLTREDNAAFGRSWEYTYDAGGNITSKREYNYANGTRGSLIKTYSYGYDTTVKDRMTSYDGQTSTYDEQGYPTVYRGSSMLWSCGQLLEYLGKTYTYNADGVRRTKGNVTYYYEGTKLLSEQRGTKRLHYLYDHNGLTGFAYDGIEYMYEKDIEGNIIGIYDMNSEGRVARYEYDAWGGCKVCNADGSENTSETFIGNINPFRYKSYYYDSETKLYYLISRYYDPETGRFISPDHMGYMAEQMERINGCNLYAYCLNNPVMYSDPEGTFILFALIGAIVGFAVSFASSAVSQAVTNNGEVDWGVAFVDGAFGAVSGFLGAATAGIAVPRTISVAVDMVLSFANSAITTGMQNNWTYGLADYISIGVNTILSGATSKAFIKNNINMFNTAAAQAFKETVNEGTFKTVTSAVREIGTGMFEMYTTSQALITTASTVFLNFFGNLLPSLMK